MERRPKWTSRISQKCYIPTLLFLMFFGICYESTILTTPHHTVDAKSCKTQHRLRFRDHPVSSVSQIRQECAHLCDNKNASIKGGAAPDANGDGNDAVGLSLGHCRSLLHLNFFEGYSSAHLPNYTLNAPFVNKSSPNSYRLPIEFNAVEVFREKRTLLVIGAMNSSSCSYNGTSSLPSGSDVSVLSPLHNLTSGDTTRIYSSEEFERKYVCNDLPPFDTVIVEDLNENLNPWNDVITVAKAWCVTKAGSKLILLFPEDKFSGSDAVFNDLRRSYGTQRLRYITKKWYQIGESKKYFTENQKAVIAFTFSRA